MDVWHEFHGPNAGYLIDQYDRYRSDPTSVDADLRAFFRALTPEQARQLAGETPTATPQMAAGLDPQKIAAAIHLAQAIRWYGHFDAQLDPLGSAPIGDPALRQETYGLSDADLRQIPANLLGGTTAEQVAQAGGTAFEVIRELRAVYSGRIGFDYLQNRHPDERRWLRTAAESRRFTTLVEPIDPLHLLDRLTRIEAFEQFLQRTFTGKTRFSVEGLDLLVPMMEEIVGRAAQAGIYNILIGMAHRGRLNLLTHLLNKPIDQILGEFKDPLQRWNVDRDPTGFTGDVKYHAGALTVVDEDNDPETVNLTLMMAPNPSHLEAVNPVVEGMARAAGTRADQPGPAQFDPSITLPILIHGDASFPGQGVVAETLNLYRLNGYTTGGTIHIIANNQIGFTTNPTESRSTLFASDLAKGFRIPIIHVNADDPEACLTASRTAFAYRAEFHRDFVIDLIGYRRRGHNEGDEPAFTQPGMYERIQNHPTVRAQWAERLVQQGRVAAEEAEMRLQAELQRLQAAYDSLDPTRLVEPIPAVPPPGAARSVKTDVPAERLAALNQALADLPETFHLHPRLERIRQRRPQISPVGDALIDWITAEELALASILEEGIPVRLTGQDVERGTFSHRHAVLHDAQTGERFIPLHHLSQVRAAFEIHNSPLSEYAALGFEFGYNVQAPERLVIWEAQYGDFINNAQTIVDEFLTSGRDKWGLLPSLVLLLPHGYEGQGPDHSSGRLERFLGLAADKNLRVANCTTAANYFHLLRRQALLLTVDPLPLVVMTPKSLLRHPLVHSPLREFTEAGWQPVIDRPLAGQPEEPGEVRQALLCSGKLYVDLVSSELAIEHPDTRIVRLEQLAPFPTEAVKKVLERYPNLMELTWVQEEPLNMGAAGFVQPYLEELCEQYRPGGLPFRVVARPVSSSPAEGSSALHLYRQRKLIEEAFTAGSQPDRLENGEHPREDTGTRSGESQKEEKGRA